MVSTTGLGDFFTPLIRALSVATKSAKSKRARDLKALADRKFRELQDTHGLFIDLLNQLYEAAKSTAERLAQSDDTDGALASLLQAIDAVGKSRESGIDIRIHHFVEAKVYAQGVLADNGILKTLDDDMTSALINVMSSYTGYFQVESAYLHELSRAILGVESSIAIHWRTRKSLSMTKDQLCTAARDAETIARNSILRSRERWTNFVEQYHQFNFLLEKKGLF